MSTGPEGWKKHKGETVGYTHVGRFWIVTAYVVLGTLSLVMLFPLIGMLCTSLKPLNEIVSDNPTLLPEKVQWHNFIDAVTAFPFLRYLGNTIILTVGRIAGTLISCSLVAWGFARVRTRLSMVLFGLCLAPMMLPPQVTAIPVFLGFIKVGLYDTYWPLILPAWLGVNAFNIFLLRQFFRSIPEDLLDAARVDGCGELGAFLHVGIPLSLPVLWVIGVFTFIARWNDYFGPLVYLASEDKYPLSVGLTYFQQASLSPTHDYQWNLLMAASLLVMIPVIILFFIAQKTFVENVTLTGIKG